MKQYSRLRAVIDLDAIEYNMDHMHANLKEETKMLAVLKTDGYGHGAIPIAEMLEEKEYVWGYAVALADEGASLRRAGVKKPILCLGCVFPEEYEMAINEGIRMNIYSYEMAEAISRKAVSLGKIAYFHIKLDTAMSRLGFLVTEESVDEIEKISKLPGIVMEGLFTHFAKADELDKTSAKKQMEAYLWMKEELEKRKILFSYYHCSNSAGIIDLPWAQMSMVRAGIAMYGLYPSDEVDHLAITLRPAMQIFAHVTHVKWIEAGRQVSYGGTFEAEKSMQVATVPIGYGDGYPRSLSNKGYVLIHGKKAPILGRVCMDQLMVDVTDMTDVKVGDLVTIVGENEGAFLPVEVLSELSGRFPYEFICDINKRVPREYVRNGKVIKQVEAF